jgi:hypothetical protein
MAEGIRRFVRYRATSDAQRRRLRATHSQLSLFPADGETDPGRKPTFFSVVDQLVVGCTEEFKLVAALLELAGWRLLGEQGGWWKAERTGDQIVARGLGAASLMAAIWRLESGERVRQLELPLP